MAGKAAEARLRVRDGGQEDGQWFVALQAHPDLVERSVPHVGSKAVFELVPIGGIDRPKSIRIAPTGGGSARMACITSEPAMVGWLVRSTAVTPLANMKELR